MTMRSTLLTGPENGPPHRRRARARMDFVVREVRPGPDVTEDGPLMEYVRATTQTTLALRRAAAAWAVTRLRWSIPQLRVRGVDGLRIIDFGVSNDPVVQHHCADAGGREGRRYRAAGAATKRYLLPNPF